MRVFRSQRTGPSSLVDILRSLPPSVTVFVLDGGFLVVGPAGLFVLTQDEGDLASAARRAAEQADAVRLQLADELVWVPFVDAMCVTTDAAFDPRQPCLVVPHDLVAHTIVGGPTTVDNETLAKLRLLRHRVLV
ncbi:MAG: hypothetical protein K1X38_00495 [Microthrixaceae bacterium]|nr:hypothetical protein [Microthrixaceae bacterium]